MSIPFNYAADWAERKTDPNPAVQPDGRRENKNTLNGFQEGFHHHQRPCSVHTTPAQSSPPADSQRLLLQQNIWFVRKQTTQENQLFI